MAPEGAGPDESELRAVWGEYDFEPVHNSTPSPAAKLTDCFLGGDATFTCPVGPDHLVP